MVMMVMVVMVPGGGGEVTDAALPLVAVLIRTLQFQRDVRDAVLAQLLADAVLDVVGIRIGDHVHGGVIVLPIDAPDVNVVNVKNSVYVANMLLYLTNVYAVRRFFKENIQRFL